MPIDTNPFVMQAILHGFVTTEETINVFYFASATFDDPLSDFVSAWVTAALNYLAPVLGVSTLLDTVTCNMVKGSSAFFSQAISIAGTTSGDQCPPYVTWDFTYVRGGVAERNGYKRFSGVPESLQANGVATGGALANLNVVADKLENSVTLTADEWFPVIKRTRVAKITQNPPVYYDTSSVIYSKVGSQNSRKFGHGR